MNHTDAPGVLHRKHSRDVVRGSSIATLGMSATPRTDMALRHDDLSPEELARQRALDRSWRAAQKALSDPGMREYLEKSSIERVNSSDAPSLPSEEFQAQGEPAGD